MRKISVGLVLLSVAATGQARQIANAFESVGSHIFDLASTLSLIIIPLALIYLFIKVVFSEDGFDLVKTLPVVGLAVGMPIIIRMMRDIAGLQPSESPVDDQPGALSRVFSWIGDHGIALAVGAGCLTAAGYFASRVYVRRTTAQLVQQQRREILEALDRVETYLVYWSKTMPTYEASIQTKAGRLKVLEEIQDEMLAYLEQVQNGMPLDAEQVRKFSAAKNRAEKTAIDCNGVRIRELPRQEDPDAPTLSPGTTSNRTATFTRPIEEVQALESMSANPALIIASAVLLTGHGSSSGENDDQAFSKQHATADDSGVDHDTACRVESRTNDYSITDSSTSCGYDSGAGSAGD